MDFYWCFAFNWHFPERREEWWVVGLRWMVIVVEKVCPQQKCDSLSTCITHGLNVSSPASFIYGFICLYIYLFIWDNTADISSGVFPTSTKGMFVFPFKFAKDQEQRNHLLLNMCSTWTTLYLVCWQRVWSCGLGELWFAGFVTRHQHKSTFALCKPAEHTDTLSRVDSNCLQCFWVTVCKGYYVLYIRINAELLS